MSRPRSTYPKRQRQLSRIHILKKELVEAGLLNEDGYRAMIGDIQHRLGIAQRRDLPSSADLNARGRDELIRSLENLNGKTLRKSPVQEQRRYVGNGERGDDGFHLTQDQANWIEELENRLGWMDDPKRIVGFIERQIGKRKTVPMLTNSEATKVITGLERMLNISNRPRSTSKKNA